ncbi:hypothetical protein [Anabaena azotica]|uniref:DUF433 domain-containing protein n=1 Tax=Anabaena azotica FACHB-119 TaxID=947527 RepID=A0ABR8DER6_9NOST|nr:hypothetical protein [Anabaena azotica]MBD2504606.1 hypothetical protein [Anabaena azotica FACHB-119]
MGEGEVKLVDLVSVTQYLISKIAQHPDFIKLEYYPDLTIGDAQTALSYLQSELEANQQSAATVNVSD